MSGDGSSGCYLMKLDLKHGTDPKVQLRLKSLKLYFHLQFSFGSSFNIYDGVGVVEGSERTTTTTTTIIIRRRTTTATTTTKETHREKREKRTETRKDFFASQGQTYTYKYMFLRLQISIFVVFVVVVIILV